MGYYTRVFCKAEQSPSFSEIQAYMSSVNPAYKLEGDIDDNGSDWTYLEVFYKEGKHPIPVELDWFDEDDSVGKDEVTQFIEEITSPEPSVNNERIVKWLSETKYIICNQLLLSDLGEDGFRANDHLMQFFVKRYQGMIHAENEGFYDSDNNLL